MIVDSSTLTNGNIVSVVRGNGADGSQVLSVELRDPFGTLINRAAIASSIPGSQGTITLDDLIVLPSGGLAVAWTLAQTGSVPPMGGSYYTPFSAGGAAGTTVLLPAPAAMASLDNGQVALAWVRPDGRVMVEVRSEAGALVTGPVLSGTTGVVEDVAIAAGPGNTFTLIADRGTGIDMQRYSVSWTGASTQLNAETTSVPVAISSLFSHSAFSGFIIYRRSRCFA